MFYLRGVITPSCTAFKEDGTFDPNSQKKLFRYQAENKVTAVFPLGLTGETFSISDNYLRQEVMKASSEIVCDLREEGHNIRLLLGVNGGTIDETISNIQYANDLRSSGLILQPSKVKGITDIETFTLDILNTVKKPIYFYSNPNTALDGEQVKPWLPQKFYMNSAFSGVKVSDTPAVVQKFCGFDYNNLFGIYIGNAIDMFSIFGEERDKYLILPVGVVSGPANPMPGEWVKAWKLCQEGESLELDKVRNKIYAFKKMYNNMPSVKTHGSKDTIAALKAILYIKGIFSSPQCLGRNPTDEDIEYFRKEIQKIEDI